MAVSRIRNILIVSTLLASLPGLAAETVVIKTRDFVVTTQDFEHYLNAQGYVGERRERSLARKGAVKQVFENMYVMRAFAQEGEKNPAIDKDEIEWLVKSYRERLLMDRQLALEVDKELRSKDWGALAEEEYKANKKDYIRPEKVSASHILISSEERTEEEALTKAEELLDRLKSGEDFAALAKEFSDDTGSGAKGGDLGTFGRKRMVKPFADAAFAMRNSGEISSPVLTRFGYHIIRLDEYRPENQLSFKEAERRVMSVVKKRIAETVRQEKISAVQSGTVDLGLEVDVPLLEEIEQRYAPTDAPESLKQ